MERDADPQLWLAAVAAVALAYGGETLGGGGERGLGGLCGADLWPAPENRQYAVAHDLHDLAAMLADRRDHGVEIVVEQAYYGARVHRVRQQAEIAQVDQHQRGGDRRHVAAPHLAFQDQPSGLGADV